ncbi:thioredoxin [Thermococci archaeon]|nr:MAG: thioredoxin [Thermococci archaeon]RLF93159.1 MAG: thioredoxin [Thermococci archaeon]
MGEIIESKDDEFWSVIKRRSKEKLIIVEFYSPRCFPCKMMDPVLEEVSKEMDVIIAKHNVRENSRIPLSLKIRAVPTLIFVKDGEVVKVKRGFTKKEKLEEMIEEIMESLGGVRRIVG